MKILISFLVLAFVFVFVFAVEVPAQKKTVILIRHAEKDLSDPSNSDPDLSAEGKARAERLISALRKYKPSAIYATEYKRTQQTAAPIAAKSDLTVERYNPRQLAAFAGVVRESKARRVLVVGHNNTTPALTSLLMGAPGRFKDLDEKEYGKIFILQFNKRGNLKRVDLVEY